MWSLHSLLRQAQQTNDKSLAPVEGINVTFRIALYFAQPAQFALTDATNYQSTDLKIETKSRNTDRPNFNS
jgi:hypothetical protein